MNMKGLISLMKFLLYIGLLFPVAFYLKNLSGLSLILGTILFFAWASWTALLVRI